MRWRAIVVLLVMSFPSHAGAQLDPEMEKPYRLQVVLHVAENRFLTPIFQEQLQGALRDHLQLSLGSLAQVEVVRAHPLLADVEAKGLETGLDSWERLSDVKTHFVLVDYSEGTYVVKARQYDGMTGLLSPLTRQVRTSDRTLVAMTAARLVEQDFGLVGTVAQVGKEVQVALKGGKLGVPLDRWVKPGEVFAVSRITGAGAKQRGTRVAWALLEVLDTPRDGSCACRLWHRFQEDDLRDLPGVLGYRCLKLTTTSGPVKLRIIDNDQLQPLAFLQVNVLKPGDQKTSELTTNRDGLVVTRDSYKHFALVRIMAGETVRSQFPVEITGAGTVVCRLKVQADAEAQTALEFRKEQWARRILDNLHLASERVAELNRELNQSLDIALATARSGVQTMDSEVDYLTLERDRIRSQAEEKKVKLDLGDGDLGLAALRKKKDELGHFVTRTQETLKEARSEKTLVLAKMLERARLLEGEADFEKAIVLYDQVLQASPDQPKVKEHLAHLKAAWTPKSPQHAEARAFLVQTWPNLEAGDLKNNLDQAQKSLAVCRAAGDKLTALKVMQTTVVHAAHLQKHLDTLKRQESPDNISQAKIVTQVIEGLRRLHAEASLLAGKGKRE